MPCMNPGTLLLPALLVILVDAASAQPTAFPQRPIRIVVPVPPGGSIDAVTRLIAPKMSDSLGQSIVIDNRSGASTNIGMELVARATPDGHTLLANTIPVVANPALFQKLPFHPEKDFVPISLIVNGPSVHRRASCSRGAQRGRPHRARKGETGPREIFVVRPRHAARISERSFSSICRGSTWRTCPTKAAGRRLRRSCPANAK